MLTCSNTDGLTLEQLQNTVYQSDWAASGIVQLTDGQYQEKIAEDSAARLFIWLEEVHAFGDINYDDVKDAVVLLATNAGGSGTFYTLAAVINTKAGPEHVASRLLGDRVKVKSISIEERFIIVNIITHGPDDPMCCPTKEVTQEYLLDDEQLIQFTNDMEYQE